MQYVSDGSLRIMGRKDHQIKIWGQRVESSDIEQNIMKCFPLAGRVAAELVQSKTGKTPAVLMTFIEMRHASCSAPACHKEANYPFIIPCEKARKALSELEEKLQNTLPTHMIPTRFLTLDNLLLSRSGWQDRPSPAIVTGSVGLRVSEVEVEF